MELTESKVNICSVATFRCLQRDASVSNMRVMLSVGPIISSFAVEK